MYYCRKCGIGQCVIKFANNDVVCCHCGKRVIPMGTDEKGFPITIYASKEEYLETHFEYWYTWVCENFDTDDIEEKELKKIVESAILKQLDGYTNDETIKVYQLNEDNDAFGLYIFHEIEDILDSKK